MHKVIAALVVAAVLAMPEANGQGADTFTVAVIPDTQIYVQTTAGTEFFSSQFEWIVEQQQERNIVFVSHVGDVSQEPSSVTEWDRIEGVYELLDDVSLPYGIAPGNHDINDDATAPEYDARFGVSRYLGKNWFGGHHVAEGNRSSFQTVTIDGHELLFLHLRHLQAQYGPVAPVLDWADGVLDGHPDHLVFVTTHEFTNNDGTVLYPELQAVLQDSCNVVAVFSGHRVAGSAAGSFEDSCDRTIHHVLTNYQTFANGGQGYLRTVQIDRLTLEAQFQVYSPTLDEFRTAATERFTAQLAPLPLVAGDASCDRRVSIADALYVAQVAVGNRAERATCPLPAPTADANTVSADANGDGEVTLFDALLIAQCGAGLPNVLCPEVIE